MKKSSGSIRFPAALAIISASFVASSHAVEIFSIPLDGDTKVVSPFDGITARAGNGTEFLKSNNGQGLISKSAGPALIANIPANLWQSAGTLAFNFQTSRKLSSGPAAEGGNFRVKLIDSPLFKASLRENRSGLTLEVETPGSDGKKFKSRLNWSHLKAAKWYNLAFAWDAGKGEFDCFLNGAAQEKLRFRPSLKDWTPPKSPKGALSIGGSGGSGKHASSIAIDHVQLFDTAMNETAMRKALQGRVRMAMTGEGRTAYAGKLNFQTYALELVYSADFSQPLSVATEDDLFEDGKRKRKPEGKDWVLEGPGRAWTEDDKLHIESHKPDKGGHVVLWNTRRFPENCLIEFDMSPTNSTKGLNIIFFAAQSRDGKDIFDLSLPKRGGTFKNYHSGSLDSYHISYWACAADNGGTPRRTANIRKNHGFQLVSCGTDNIAGKGEGPHTVRLLRFEGRILLETNGKLAAVFYDTGKAHGPVLKGGQIGLRQMGHTHRASYGSFTVYKITKKPPQKLPQLKFQ